MKYVRQRSLTSEIRRADVRRGDGLAVARIAQFISLKTASFLAVFHWPTRRAPFTCGEQCRRTFRAHLQQRGDGTGFVIGAGNVVSGNAVADPVAKIAAARFVARSVLEPLRQISTGAVPGGVGLNHDAPGRAGSLGCVGYLQHHRQGEEQQRPRCASGMQRKQQ